MSTSRLLPHAALSRHAHDRHGQLRDDDRWLEERWADPETRVLVLAGARVRPVEGRLSWVSPQEAPEGLRVLLGERDGVVHFAVIVDPDDAPGERDEWVVLRAVVQSLAEETVEDGPLVLHAIGLAEWLWATRHCPRCGGGLEPRMAGHVLRCAELRPRPVPALGPRSDHGRHRRRDRAARRAGAARSQPGLARGPVLDAGGVRGAGRDDGGRGAPRGRGGDRCPVGEVSYFGSQPWPLPASLMVGFTARAVETAHRRRRRRRSRTRAGSPASEMRGRGRGRNTRAARRRLDLALPGRELVRRTPAPGPRVR